MAKILFVLDNYILNEYPVVLLSALEYEGTDCVIGLERRGETTLSIRTTLICRLAASDLICETGRETGRACWLQQHESLTLVSTSAKFHNDQKLHRYSRNLPWSARREAGNKKYHKESPSNTSDC